MNEAYLDISLDEGGSMANGFTGAISPDWDV